MATTTLSAFPLRNSWPASWGASGTFVVALSQTVSDAAGTVYPKCDNLGDSLASLGYHWSSTITVASHLATCGSVSGLPKTDVTTPADQARYFLYVYDSKGKLRIRLNSTGWRLDSYLGDTINFLAWQAANTQQYTSRATQIVTDANTLRNLIAATSNNVATTTQLGIGEVDTTPADPATPIFVGVNSPILPTVGQRQALVGTSGSPSSTNLYVTDADFRLPSAAAFVWADRFVSLTAALSYCASTYPTGATLVVSTDITQAGDISIPLTVTLFFTNAGRLSVVSGTTFIRAGIIGGLRKIFNLSGSGAISFNANTSVPVQYPQWFGATGDGSTDDTAAINQAIDAFNTGTGGVLEFGRGVFKVTGALHAITADGIIRGQGQSHSNSSQADAATKINCTSQSAVLFTVNSLAFKFRDLAIFNTYAGTPSSTSVGIKVTNATNNSQKVDYDSVTVWGFYYNVDVQVGGYWKMDNCLLIGPVQTALRINNTVNADAGDWSIVNTFISGLTYDAGPAIQINGSGGGKIVNLKINGYLHYFTDGIQVNPATTGILLVSNSSIENVTGHGIIVTGDVLGSSWYFVNLDNIEIDIVPVVANTKNAVHLTKVTGVNIDNLHVRGNNVSGVAAILLDNCSNVNVPETAVANTDFGRIVQITNGYSGYLLPFEDTVALTISSNTLTPLFRTSSVSGGGVLKTISTPVYSTERRAVTVTFIPLSNFTYDTTGNVAAGGSGTATAGRAITFTYLPTQDKFYPSY